MLRSIEIKIVLIFTIIGIIAISSLGMLLIHNLQKANVNMNNIIEISEINSIMNTQI